MYLAFVVLVMVVVPIASIIVELATGSAGGWIVLVGKWFVFWAVGVRLFVAGLNQILMPTFTAQGIFGINDKSADRIVVELGFANVGIGLTALLSLYYASWVPAAAFVGMVFLGLDGIRHVMNQDRKSSENIAMISDLWIAGILLIYLFATLIVPA